MIEIVRRHIREGIRPVPIPFRQKSPTIKEWEKLRITEENVDKFFNGDPVNVGAILGEASAGLQDVDLDCPEAVRLAPVYLPTTRTFGRLTHPTSHYLFRSPDLNGEGTKQFDDPFAKLNRRKSKIIELRSNGGQTVLPGSTHKETGELISWDNPDLSITECSRATLERIVAEIAAGSMLLRYWKDTAAVAIVSVLKFAGWEPNKISLFLAPIAGSVDFGLPETDPSTWYESLNLPRISERADQKEYKEWGNAKSHFISKINSWLGIPTPKPPKTISIKRSNRTDREGEITRVTAFVAAMPAAIAGSGGHDATFYVARKLFGFHLITDDERWDFLQQYNTRCQPPWSEKELRHKFEQGKIAKDQNVIDRPFEERGGKVIYLVPPASGELPKIKITVSLADVTDLTVTALAADPGVYQRDGSLVHVVRTEPEKAGDIREGTPQVCIMALPTLRERLTRVARFYKIDGRNNDWTATIPTNDLTQAVHCRREWKGIRDIVGVLESPSLRPDGGLIDVPGYDAATKFLYSPPCDYPPIPKLPTQDDARQALADLREIFVDFPFASPAARDVPLAALLTILGRPAILGACPGFLFDAPTPGTGKSLCSDAVCTVATGRPAPRGTFPHNEEELEKILGAYALRSALVVGFDNIAHGFGGAPLDKVLTAVDTVDIRVLGRSEMPTIRWRAIMLGSGNNIHVIGDTNRRVLVARIESLEENPEKRDVFKHYPLLPWVSENRRRLVIAALTVLRAFVVAGRPFQQVKPLGGFEAWSELIVQAIIFAGGENVIKARPGEGQGMGGDRGLTMALLDGWRRLLVAKNIPSMTARGALTLLYGLESPTNLDELREAIETMTSSSLDRPPTARQLGDVLRKLKDRPFGGVKLVSDQDRNGIAKWWIETRSETAGSRGETGSFQAVGPRDGNTKFKFTDLE